MARRRWYRRYPRVVAAKKKWASNIKIGELVTQAGTEINSAVLVANKTQTTAPTPTIIKTGNFKVQGDLYMTASEAGYANSAVVYILFVPEGFNNEVSVNLIENHPEWIMGWTVVDSGVTPSTERASGSKFSITSRLKRNLNSGDSVLLVFQFSTSTVSGAAASIRYTAQYWTCAN